MSKKLPEGFIGKNYTEEFQDFDYLNKLSKEELEFMIKFSNEYYADSFTGKPNLHTKEQRKELYRANYYRRYDISNNANKINKSKVSSENILKKSEKVEEKS